VSRTSYNTAIWFAQVVSDLANFTRQLLGSLWSSVWGGVTTRAIPDDSEETFEK
jgi:hypothetical protein